MVETKRPQWVTTIVITLELLLLLLLHTQVACGDVINRTETEILEELYEQTRGEYWEHNDNWLEGDPCSDKWFGISCTPQQSVLTMYEL